MSKSSNHYNWQKWISQTNHKKNDKLLLEMREEWMDKIYDAISTFKSGKADNLRSYFGSAGRIVVPFDESKMNKLAYTMMIARDLTRNRVDDEARAFKGKIIQKYLGMTEEEFYRLPFDTKQQLIKEKIPESYVYKDTYAKTLMIYSANLSEAPTINIRKKVVNQKFTPAGGGPAETKQVEIYEPIIEYVYDEPWSPKTPEEAKKGESSNKRKIEITLAQALQRSNQTDVYQWWEKNQSKFMQDLATVEGARDIYNHQMTHEYPRFDDMIKGFNSTNEGAASTKSIIVSRVPVDVLRMSDHAGIYSCHSQPEEYGGNGYFYCALAEARNQGAIAYLVKSEDLNKIDLNAPEIFADPQRNIDGIVPLNRVRIRRLVDSDTGMDYMANETRVYGDQRTVGFVETVKKWISEQTRKVLFDPSSTDPSERYFVPDISSLKMLGGHYTDSGMAKLTFDFAESIGNALDATTETQEQKDYVDQIKSSMQSFSRREQIYWEGEEDENETRNECTEAQEEVEGIKDNYNSYSDISRIEIEVECDGGDIESINSEITLEFIFDSDINFIFSPTGLDELSKTTSYGAAANKMTVDLRETVRQTILSEASNPDMFNSSRFIVRHDVLGRNNDQLFVRVIIENSFASTFETQSTTYGIRRSLNSIDYDSIRGTMLLEFRRLGIAQLPLVQTEKIQDMIQKFAESANVEGNHFQWSDNSTEGVDDIFYYVEDPTRLISINNLPVVGKVPIYVPEITAEKGGGTAMAYLNRFSEFTRRINTSGLLDKIFTAVGSPESKPSQYLLPFSNLSQNRTLSNIMQSQATENLPPYEDIIDITIVAREPEINQFRRTDAVRQTNLDIVMQLKFTIDKNQRTEQEVINTINYMEKLGSAENYDKVVEVVSEHVRYYFNDNQNFISSWQKEMKNEMDYAARNKISDQPIPSKYGSTPIEKSPLFSGEPVNPNAWIPENKQKKKLVINERFKSLLRNINK